MAQKYIRRFSLLAIAISTLGFAARSQAQIFSWPVHNPITNLAVTVGYGYFSPFGIYSPWYYPVFNPYGFALGGFHYSTYGAIAYSPSAKVSGFSHSALSRADAIDSAVSYCGADDCRPIVWVTGGCAAIAVGKSEAEPEKAWIGWSYQLTRLDAVQYAMRGCRSGGIECRAHTWVCTP